MESTEQLRPELFLTRPGGRRVPLIAIDELPPNVSIRGVPRCLEPGDLKNMTGIGLMLSRHRTYTVDGPSKTLSTDRSCRDRSLLASAFASSDPASFEVKSSSIFPQPPKAYGIQEQMPDVQSLPGTMPAVSRDAFRTDRNPGPNPLPPWHDSHSLSLKAAPGTKEYCSFWLRRGECDYAQQGCLYKHEMPLDIKILESLGLRDIPKWYRERHGLGSFLAAGSTSEKSAAMENDWRAVGAPAEREKKNGKERHRSVLPKQDVATPTRARSTNLEKMPSGRIHRRMAPQELPSQAPARSRRMPSASPVIQFESIRERQTRETIRQLQADEEEQRQKKALNSKFTVLEPKKRVPMPSPPSSSEDDIAPGSTNNDELNEEGVEEGMARVALE